MTVTTADIVTEENVRRVVTEALEENLTYREAYRSLDITGSSNDTITIPQDDDTLAEPQLIPENTQFPREEEGVSTITATVSKYGNEIAVSMESEEDSVFDVVAFQVDKKARMMAEKLNQLAESNLASNLHTSSPAGDAGDDSLSFDDVTDGVRLLEASGAEPDLMITTPQGIEDLRNDSTYVQATATGDQVVRSGAVDRILGMDVMMDNDGLLGNTNPDAYLIDTDNYGFEVMKGGIQTDEYEDPSRQARIFQIWTRVTYRTDISNAAIEVQG